ncbi:MAG: LamG-like jellyroll fold domain-containing protein, partial [Candidatus Kariarchaeaceae archaeon]
LNDLGKDLVFEATGTTNYDWSIRERSKYVETKPEQWIFMGEIPIGEYQIYEDNLVETINDAYSHIDGFIERNAYTIEQMKIEIINFGADAEPFDPEALAEGLEIINKPDHANSIYVRQPYLYLDDWAIYEAETRDEWLEFEFEDKYNNRKVHLVQGYTEDYLFRGSPDGNRFVEIPCETSYAWIDESGTEDEWWYVQVNGLPNALRGPNGSDTFTYTIPVEVNFKNMLDDLAHQLNTVIYPSLTEIKDVSNTITLTLGRNQQASTSYVDLKIKDQVFIYLDERPISQEGDLIAWWSFDETSKITDGTDTWFSDETGHGQKAKVFDGANNSTVTFLNEALTVDGASDYLEVESSEHFNTDIITISARVCINSVASGLFPFIGKWDDTGDNKRSYAMGLSDGKLWAGVSSDGTGDSGKYVSLTDSTALTTGKWYTLTMTFDGTRLRMYINGVLKGYSANTIEGLYKSNEPFRIGGMELGGAGWKYFNGNIDEIRIWNTSHDITSTFDSEPTFFVSDSFDNDIIDSQWNSITSTDSIIIESEGKLKLMANSTGAASGTVTQEISGSHQNFDIITQLSWERSNTTPSKGTVAVKVESTSGNIASAGYYDTATDDGGELIFTVNTTNSTPVSINNQTGSRWIRLVRTGSGVTVYDGGSGRGPSNWIERQTGANTTNATKLTISLEQDSMEINNWIGVSTLQVDSMIYEGLISHWKLESNANDSYGTNNGTWTGESYGNGKIGTAGSFNGSNAYISLSDITIGQELTISTWINADSNDAGTWSGIFGAYSETKFIHLQLSSSNTINYYVYGKSLGNASGYDYSNDFDEWHHIALVVGNSTIKLFIDGVEEDSISSNSNTITSTTNSVSIGRVYASSRMFDGLIDDVRLYNRVLNENEISKLAMMTPLAPLNKINMNTESPIKSNSIVPRLIIPSNNNEQQLKIDIKNNNGLETTGIQVRDLGEIVLGVGGVGNDIEIKLSVNDGTNDYSVMLTGTNTNIPSYHLKMNGQLFFLTLSPYDFIYDSESLDPFDYIHELNFEFFAGGQGASTTAEVYLSKFGLYSSKGIPLLEENFLPYENSNYGLKEVYEINSIDLYENTDAYLEEQAIKYGWTSETANYVWDFNEAGSPSPNIRIAIPEGDTLIEQGGESFKINTITHPFVAISDVIGQGFLEFKGYDELGDYTETVTIPVIEGMIRKLKWADYILHNDTIYLSQLETTGEFIIESMIALPWQTGDFTTEPTQNLLNTVTTDNAPTLLSSESFSTSNTTFKVIEGSFSEYDDDFNDGAIDSPPWTYTQEGCQQLYMTEEPTDSTGRLTGDYVDCTSSGWQNSFYRKSIDIDEISKVELDYEFRFGADPWGSGSMGLLRLQGKESDGSVTFSMGFYDYATNGSYPAWSNLNVYNSSQTAIYSSYLCKDSYRCSSPTSSGHMTVEFSFNESTQQNEIKLTMTKTWGTSSITSGTQTGAGETAQIEIFYRAHSDYNNGTEEWYVDNYEETSREYSSSDATREQLDGKIRYGKNDDLVVWDNVNLPIKETLVNSVTVIPTGSTTTLEGPLIGDPENDIYYRTVWDTTTDTFKVYAGSLISSTELINKTSFSDFALDNSYDIRLEYHPTDSDPVIRAYVNGILVDEQTDTDDILGSSTTITGGIYKATSSDTIFDDYRLYKPPIGLPDATFTAEDLSFVYEDFEYDSSGNKTTGTGKTPRTGSSYLLATKISDPKIEYGKLELQTGDSITTQEFTHNDLTHYSFEVKSPNDLGVDNKHLVEVNLSNNEKINIIFKDNYVIEIQYDDTVTTEILEDNVYLPNTWYSGEVVISDMDISVSLRPQTIPEVEDELIAYWPFEGTLTNVITDEDATNNGAEITDGYNGGAYSFIGNNDDYLSAPETNINWADFFKDDDETEFTISTWIYATNLTPLRSTILGSQYCTGYFLGTYDDDKVIFAWDDGKIYSNSILYENEWYNVVIAFHSENGGSGRTNYGTIYINGQVDGGYDQSISDTAMSELDVLNIGRNDRVDYNYPFTGIIDEVKIFDKALTPAEIKRLYDDNLSLEYTIRIPQIKSSTVKFENIGASEKFYVDNISFQTMQQSPDSTNELNGGNYTGDLTEGWLMQTSVNIGNIDTIIEEIDTDLWAHWSLDGNANDVSGNNRNGTTSGSIFTTGYSNQGILIDATNDKKITGNYRTLVMSNTAGKYALIHTYEETCLYDGTGAKYFELNGQRYTVPDSDWHHYTVVYKANDAELYVDGVYKGKTGAMFDTGSYPLTRIGANTSGGENGGYIDEVRFYDRELTRDEISILYNQAVNLEIELNNNNIKTMVSQVGPTDLNLGQMTYLINDKELPYKPFVSLEANKLTNSDISGFFTQHQSGEVNETFDGTAGTLPNTWYKDPIFANGTFEIDSLGETLEIEASSSDTPQSLVGYYGFKQYSDFEVSYKIKLTDSTYTGVILRGENKDWTSGSYGHSTWYEFQMSTQATGTHKFLYKQNGSAETVIWSETGTNYTTGTWYNIRIRVIGDSFTMYVDDVLETTQMYTGRARGRLGFFKTGIGNPTCIDDFKVSLLNNELELASIVTGYGGLIFDYNDQAELKEWMAERLQNNRVDYIVLGDKIPSLLYNQSGTELDLALWLENNNGIITIGDNPFKYKIQDSDHYDQIINISAVNGITNVLSLTNNPIDNTKTVSSPNINGELYIQPSQTYITTNVMDTSDITDENWFSILKLLTTDTTGTDSDQLYYRENNGVYGHFGMREGHYQSKVDILKGILDILLNSPIPDMNVALQSNEETTGDEELVFGLLGDAAVLDMSFDEETWNISSAKHYWSFNNHYTDNITGYTGTNYGTTKVTNSISNEGIDIGGSGGSGYGNNVVVADANVMDLDLDTEFSVTFWINPDTYVCSALLRQDNQIEIYRCDQSSDSVITVRFWNSTENHTDGTIPVNNNEWTMVTVTYDGTSEAKLYINDKLDPNYPWTISGSPSSTTSNLGIGAYPDKRYSFDGSMDELAIYDYVLTESEISDLYSYGLSHSIKNQVFSNDFLDAQFIPTNSINVVTNTDLDTGWSKVYTTSIQWNDIAPPEGVDSPVVSFIDHPTYPSTPQTPSSYWYSYGDYAPQEPNTTYTISIYVKTESDSGFSIRAYTADNSETGRQWTEYVTVTSADGWKRVIFDPITTPSNTQSDSLSFLMQTVPNERIWLCAPQMEAHKYVSPFVDATSIELPVDQSYKNEGFKTLSAHYLQIPDHDYLDLQQFTIDFDYLPLNTSLDTTQILTKEEAYQIRQYQDNVKIMIYNGSTWSTKELVDVLTENQWSHIRTSYDGTKLRLWVDDNYGENSVTTTLNNSSYNLVIGADWDGSLNIDASIDNLRILPYATYFDNIIPDNIKLNSVESNQINLMPLYPESFVTSNTKVSSLDSVEIESNTPEVYTGSVLGGVIAFSMGGYLSRDTAQNKDFVITDFTTSSEINAWESIRIGEAAPNYTGPEWKSQQREDDEDTFNISDRPFVNNNYENWTSGQPTNWQKTGNNPTMVQGDTSVTWSYSQTVGNYSNADFTDWSEYGEGPQQLKVMDCTGQETWWVPDDWTLTDSIGCDNINIDDGAGGEVWLQGTSDQGLRSETKTINKYASGNIKVKFDYIETQSPTSSSDYEVTFNYKYGGTWYSNTDDAYTDDWSDGWVEVEAPNTDGIFIEAVYVRFHRDGSAPSAFVFDDVSIEGTHTSAAMLFNTSASQSDSVYQDIN